METRGVWLCQMPNFTSDAPSLLPVPHDDGRPLSTVVFCSTQLPFCPSGCSFFFYSLLPPSFSALSAVERSFNRKFCGGLALARVRARARR